MCEFGLRRRFLLISFWFVWIGGCATETLKPTFPTSSELRRPDLLMVYEFAVTSADLAPAGIVGSGLNRPAVQTEEDLRVGRALAKALSENLVTELRRRGINAAAATEAAPPGEATASMRGQFHSSGLGQESSVGFTLRGKELRTRIQVLQGSGLDLRVVAESEYRMPSSLQPGIPSAEITTAVRSDANRAAQALAERVADYYRKQGWLNK